MLRDHGERERRRLDYLGTTTLGLGLFGILWGLTKLTSESLNASIIEFVIAGVILLGVFALVEQRQKEPMLNLSLFRVASKVITNR